MITPRTTRLVRSSDLRSFRSALVGLCTSGSPHDARDRLVVVPARAASHHLIRTIEDQMTDGSTVVLPDFVTRNELHERLFERIDAAGRPNLVRSEPYTIEEREALLGVACRAAVAAGADPPFRVRPGLIAAMLEFFDTLKRHQKSVDDFERLTLGRLEGSSNDRGAERLIRQTCFLAAAFREYERLCRESGGVDEHAIRERLLTIDSTNGWRHIVVAVRDRAADRYGLYPADWDLLARLPRLEQLDVVVTDTALAGAFHERIHRWLPGIEEVRVPGDDLPPSAPCPLPPTTYVIARDREDEITEFARRVRDDAERQDAPALNRIAFVVRHRLPYVYLAREVFRSVGVPCQMFDALPLAGEPYAALVDLLFSFVSANFARLPAIALLRSPHVSIAGADGEPLRPGEVAALDRALSEASYLGGIDALDRLVEAWQQPDSRVSSAALRGAQVLQSVAHELETLRSSASIAEHLDVVLHFLAAHEHLPGGEVPPKPLAEADVLRVRQLRARGAVLALLRSQRDAYRRFDAGNVTFEEVAAMVRRGIDSRTFAPRHGESGVHLVDADTAPFGDFEDVQLAGLVDGEWPDRPRRNIFYSPAILRDLGWPADADRVEAARASFADLLRLPSTALTISSFSLEHDTLVSPSILLDDVHGLDGARVRGCDGARVRGGDGARVRGGDRATDGVVLSDDARAWAAHRLARPADSIGGGQTSAHMPTAYSVSSLERYQDCPFKFFASNVLDLAELPEDEAALSPRARGRFIHEVFQRFFEAWDRRAHESSGVVGPTGRSITAETYDDARAVFAEVAEPLLANLPQTDAALERTRLFGSAISVGLIDVVLGLEAAHPVEIVERWLEYRLDGNFALGATNGRAVPLRGVADRIDILSGNRLRVIDYKSGSAPDRKRALQVPIYALCAQERLGVQRGGTWEVEEAAYVAFTGKKPLVPIIARNNRTDERAAVLADARTRLQDIVGGIERGEFPPRPYEERICSYCAYPSVCRKDYVGDQ